jgi:integrase
MAQDRIKTGKPGVFYRMRRRIGGPGEERVYYVVYKKDGKLVEAKAGRQYKDQMTPAKASRFRSNLIEGREQTPEEKRVESRKKVWNLNALWDEYAGTKEKNKALETDRLRYEKHIKKPLGKKEPSELVPLDLERLRRVQCKHLSPQTQKHIIALVVRLARFGQKQGVCEGLKFIPTLPEVHNEKTEDLTPKQAKRLLEVLREWPQQDTAGIFLLAMVTGMRRGEIFKLKWDDIDFRRETIRIVDPKRGEDAIIPLNDAARDIILNLPDRKQGQDSEYVFPARDGGPRKSIQHASRKIREAVGLPNDFRMCHGLRHYYASELANSGQVEMHVLQKLMTHKTPRMTQRYAHLRDDALKQASSIAANIVNGGSLKLVK